MRFWDASAVVQIILCESPGTATVSFDGESAMCVWWGTVVEAVSAFARQERSGALTGKQVENCLSRLTELGDAWMEVAPSDALRDSARRLLRIHALRAADSLQLAAALTVAAGQPESVEFVCRDARLAEAAGREGLKIRAN